MRFAVLIHDHPFLHWDVLLETGETCRTWRLLDSPETFGPWRAEPLPDHRRLYLDYAGPVSGGRGTVQPWDAGELTWITCDESRVVVDCRGRRWSGLLTLEKQTDCQWLAAITASPTRSV
jgi:hypothetical protein